MELDRVDPTDRTRNRNRWGERNRGWRGMEVGLLRKNVSLAG